MIDNHVQEYFANCENITDGDSDALRSEIHRLIHSVRASALEQAADDLLRHLEACGLEQRQPRDINEVRREIMVLTGAHNRNITERERLQRLVETLQERVTEWMKACERAEDGREGWIPFAPILSDGRVPDEGQRVWICDVKHPERKVELIHFNRMTAMYALKGATHWKPLKFPLPPTPVPVESNGSTPVPLNALEELPAPAEGLIWSPDMDARR